MGIKASEVSECLRRSAGKRDHRKIMSEDCVVLRPGPNFDLLNPVTAQPLTPKRDSADDDCREAGAGRR